MGGRQGEGRETQTVKKVQAILDTDCPCTVGVPSQSRCRVILSLMKCCRVEKLIQDDIRDGTIRACWSETVGDFWAIFGGIFGGIFAQKQVP